MEVLTGRIHTDFLLVLLTSLSSCMVARSYLGNFPAFTTPIVYDLVSPGELPFYFIMGILIGAAAIMYVKLLYRSEDLFGGWKFPDYLKPAVGGLIVGLVLRFFPEVYGSGLTTVESALWVRFSWNMLLGLFFAELLANVATLGSGGSGGVFAPSLFMGRCWAEPSARWSTDCSLPGPLDPVPTRWSGWLRSLPPRPRPRPPRS